MVKKNPCRVLFWWKKIPTNSNPEKKKKKKIILRSCPPPPSFSTPTKNEWSVPNSIQKQIVEYNIKSKYPEEYSIVDKVGSEKPLASKSCFA